LGKQAAAPILFIGPQNPYSSCTFVF